MSTAPGRLVRTGTIGYREAWDLQRRLAEARRDDGSEDLVWLLEHPPVYTTGRHGRRADLHLSDELLAERGAEFVESDRGGQMTWHGPGQTTGYVIADLRRHGVRRFVLAQLEAMAEASGLEAAEVDAERMGVYVAGRKLGSVGLRVARGVAYHGLALNRDPDLGWFELMTACGAPDVDATSIVNEDGNPDRALIESRLAAALAARLDLDLRPGTLAEIATPA